MRCVGGEVIRGGDDIFEKEMAVIFFEGIGEVCEEGGVNNDGEIKCSVMMMIGLILAKTYCVLEMIDTAVENWQQSVRSHF